MKFGTVIIHGEAYVNGRIIGGNGLAYIASYLEKYMGFTDTFIEIDIRKLIEQKPDIVGISAATEHFGRAMNAAKEIKAALGDIPVIVGGPHISALPHKLPKCFDVGVMSEGEETMMELMKLHEAGEVRNPEKLKDVLGIVYHDEHGNVKVNHSRPLFPDLDVVPMPKFSLLKTEYGFKQSIFTTRGCPYLCTFCASTRFWNKVRFHSPERVIEEIEYIVRHYPDQEFIGIGDDLFTINVPRLRKIVSLIREHKLHEKIYLTASVKATNFNEEIAYLLRRMNIAALFFGFESGDEKILKDLKGKTSIKQNSRALELCDKYGIRVHGSFIVGAPKETEDELARTYWFIEKNITRMERAAVCFATPFPGTEFWTQAVEKKIISEDFEDWGRLHLEYDPEESLFINENFTKEEFTKHFNYFVDVSEKRWNKIIGNLRRNYTNEQFLKNTLEDVVKFFEDKGLKEVLEVTTQKELLEEFMPEGVKVKRLTAYELRDAKEDGTEKTFYDAIFCVHSIEQMKKPDEELIKLSSQLNDNGYMVLIIHNAQHISFLAELLTGQWKELVVGVHQPSHLHFMSENTIRTMLNSAGLKVIDFKDNILFNNPFEYMYNKLNPVLSGFINMDDFMRNSKPNSYTVIVQKR